MKYLSFLITFLLTLLLTISTLQAADFETGMAAYDTQRYRIASREFTALAEQGDRNAQYMLGRLYRYGNGVMQNYEQAYMWFDIAATEGHPHAKAAREAVSEEMTRRQIRQAQRLARDWQEQRSRPAISQPSPPPKPALSGATVQAIQAHLNRLGYDAGPADGKPGGRTRNAIRAYERNNRLPLSGQPSNELLAHMDQHHAAPPQNVAPDETIDDDREKPADSPWPRTLAVDDFSDGNYTLHPTWQVAAGQFGVNQLFGLHSRVEQNQFNLNTQTPGAVLMDMLQQALRENTGNKNSQLPFAEIYLPGDITNAFGINVHFTYHQPDSHMEFGVYQGYDRSDGYRLIINDQTGVTLVRLANRGSRVLGESRQRLNLKDGNRHHLEWLRYSDGNMRVTLDGRALINAGDLGFRDDFRGFTMVNRGGDFGLRLITINGTR